jgi:hypothetical protein
MGAVGLRVATKQVKNFSAFEVSNASSVPQLRTKSIEF